MAWRRPGDKPLSEPMLVNSLTHICVTRPQWIKIWNLDTTLCCCNRIKHIWTGVYMSCYVFEQIFALLRTMQVPTILLCLALRYCGLENWFLRIRVSHLPTIIKVVPVTNCEISWLRVNQSWRIWVNWTTLNHQNTSLYLCEYFLGYTAYVWDSM